jgi:hypothetical protein
MLKTIATLTLAALTVAAIVSLPTIDAAAQNQKGFVYQYHNNSQGKQTFDNKQYK